MENSSPTTSPSQAEIAALAGKIYLDSGCVPGRDLQNWLLAEAELKNRAQPHASSDQSPPRLRAENSRQEQKPKPQNKGRSRAPELLAR